MNKHCEAAVQIILNNTHHQISTNFGHNKINKQATSGSDYKQQLSISPSSTTHFFRPAECLSQHQTDLLTHFCIINSLQFICTSPVFPHFLLPHYNHIKAK